MPILRPTRSPCRGFSLLELLLVASLCAIVFTSASLAYRAVGQNQRRSTTFQEVALTSNVATNFFPGTSDTTIDSYTAPSYGRAALANQMRNLFYEDVESGSAVFALPRTGNINEIREGILTLPSDTTHPIGYWQPASYDTPAKFLDLLKDPSMTSTKTRANVFLSYRGAPADRVTSGSVTSHVTNGSIFILRPSNSPTEIWVRTVYEIDYIGFKDLKDTSRYSAGMPCVHASVRRYAWDNSNSTINLTHFYDVVFRDSLLADVGVPFVHYERAVRTNVVETGVTKWKAAGNQSFYLMWWPDPGVSRLKGSALGSYTGLPQADYAKHEGQTSFCFVVPQFPPY
mgnify:FL=1